MARPRKQQESSPEFAIYDDDGQPVAATAVREDAGREAAPPAGADAPAPFVTTAGPGRYFVKLNCPTPITYDKGLEVEADSEGDAKKKFCEANGISGSEHEFCIEKVA